jgi:hypothetical protein
MSEMKHAMNDGCDEWRCDVMDAANAVECRSHSELYRSKPQASASCWDVPLARLAASFLWDEKKVPGVWRQP